MRIYKYTLDLIDSKFYTFPKGAEILKVGRQNNNITLWFSFDENEEKKCRRKIHIVVTGWETFKPMKYIGTVFIGSNVWHVYEDTESLEEI